MMDSVLRPDDLDRPKWRAPVLGIGYSPAESTTADLIEQHREVAFDDEAYSPPRISR